MGLLATAALQQQQLMVLLMLLLLPLLKDGAQAVELNPCVYGGAESCQECLLLHPDCGWCQHEEFRGSPAGGLSRCDLVQRLLQAGCPAEQIEAPRSRRSITKDRPLSEKLDTAAAGGGGGGLAAVVQQSPQAVTLNLRPGDPVSFEVRVRQVEDYPVDIYYMMDLSLSMHDDLATMQLLGSRLAAEMAGLTSNLRLGFGSFVDKPASPYAFSAPAYLHNPCAGYKRFPKCVPSFGFRHLLSLTDEVDRFNEEVKRLNVSRNKDAPEGGFDAIMQAAVCGDRIGWRKEASHLLVFATDAASHLALDGRLGGVLRPHDGHCHLDNNDSYSAADSLDYPSLGFLGEKLAENNINLIFAVTTPYFGLYKSYTELLPGATVGILANDSSNVIELIVSAYNKIRSKVELEVYDQPDDVVLSFTAVCQNGTVRPGQRQCGGLRVRDTGSACRMRERSLPCSGRGECVCGQCLCHASEFGRVSGAFCECDNFSCLRHKGLLCSGNGHCDCGECRCGPDWVGESCSCTTLTEACLGADGRLCSGRGLCSCGRCVCTQPGAFGDVCQKCPTCPDACSIKKECVECRLFQRGRLWEDGSCAQMCVDEIQQVETIDESHKDAVTCSYKTQDDCIMSFTYTEDSDEKSVLAALKEPECAHGVSDTNAVLCVVAGVLLAGVAALLAWKLMVTVQDRRAFSRFQNDRMHAKWGAGSNPLFPNSNHSEVSFHGLPLPSGN
ncbi:integrin beta-5-like isoform X2 [Lampetra fluviatilis]